MRLSHSGRREKPAPRRHRLVGDNRVLRQERSDRVRLELFHEADRMAVVDRVALIPIGYGRSMAYVKPWVHGWWEFGKSSTSFADLVVDQTSPRV